MIIFSCASMKYDPRAFSAKRKTQRTLHDRILSITDDHQRVKSETRRLVSTAWRRCYSKTDEPLPKHHLARYKCLIASKTCWLCKATRGELAAFVQQNLWLVSHCKQHAYSLSGMNRIIKLLDYYYGFLALSASLLNWQSLVNEACVLPTALAGTCALTSAGHCRCF